MYVVSSAGAAYTNGNGTNQNFGNADLALALGGGKGVKFSGSVFNPRIWNGAIYYQQDDMAAAGPSTLMLPDPSLSPFAWRRRGTGNRGYSCAVSTTCCSMTCPTAVRSGASLRKSADFNFAAPPGPRPATSP